MPGIVKDHKRSKRRGTEGAALRKEPAWRGAVLSCPLSEFRNQGLKLSGEGEQLSKESLRPAMTCVKERPDGIVQGGMARQRGSEPAPGRR